MRKKNLTTTKNTKEETNMFSKRREELNNLKKKTNINAALAFGEAMASSLVGGACIGVTTTLVKDKNVSTGVKATAICTSIAATALMSFSYYRSGKAIDNKVKADKMYKVLLPAVDTLERIENSIEERSKDNSEPDKIIPFGVTNNSNSLQEYREKIDKSKSIEEACAIAQEWLDKNSERKIAEVQLDTVSMFPLIDSTVTEVVNQDDIQIEVKNNDMYLSKKASMKKDSPIVKKFGENK